MWPINKDFSAERRLASQDESSGGDCYRVHENPGPFVPVQWMNKWMYFGHVQVDRFDCPLYAWKPERSFIPMNLISKSSVCKCVYNLQSVTDLQM